MRGSRGTEGKRHLLEAIHSDDLAVNLDGLRLGVKAGAARIARRDGVGATEELQAVCRQCAGSVQAECRQSAGRGG